MTSIVCAVVGHKWGPIPTRDVVALASLAGLRRIPDLYVGRTEPGCLRCGTYRTAPPQQEQSQPQGEN